MKWKRTLEKVLFVAVCIILLTVLLFPFYWLLNNSFKMGKELSASPPTYFPREPTLDNFRDVFTLAPFLSYLKNSFVVALITVFVTLVFCAPASYAMGRFKGKFTLGVAMVFLCFSMFPNVSFVLPIYQWVRRLNLLNTNFSLIVTYLTFSIPSTIWLLYIYFKTVPATLEEAAQIDGTTRFGSFLRIVIPLSMPGIVSAAILAFIRCWNEFFYAFVLITAKVSKTLPVGINDYKQEYRLNWEVLAAASVLAVIPVLAIILFFQKRIESGLVAGSIK